MKFFTVLTAVAASFAGLVAANPVAIPDGHVLAPRQLICSTPSGSCNFYRSCLESKYSCGANGYPIGYGEKYCNKFAARRSNFNSFGKQWIDGTMKCLQKTLVPAAQGKSGWNTCSAVKTKAFDAHSTCYLKNGFCDLGAGNWTQLFLTVDFKDLFGSWAQLKEIVQTLDGCGAFTNWLVKEAIDKIFPL